MFKVWQRVWCAIYGEGFVDKAGEGLYPINVKFKNGKLGAYTNDGYLDLRFGNQTLFHYPVKISRDESVVIKPSIDWEHVTSEFKYLHQDKEGRCWLSKCKPTKLLPGGRWVEGGITVTADHFSSLVIGTCDWTNSLVKRPE